MDRTLLWVTAIGSVTTADRRAGLGRVAHAWRGEGAVRLLREQAEREARPYVVAEVVPGLHGPGSWDLVVRNVGRTIAHDVTIDTGDIPVRGAADYFSELLVRYLTTPRMIAPGARQRVMWKRDEARDQTTPRRVLQGR